MCVAHVSHGICYVVHGIPTAAAAAAAADRLIRGPAPLAFSFGCLDILISPSRFSRSPSRPPPSSACTYACKNHNPATHRLVRACVSPRAARVCASASAVNERPYHGALSFADLRASQVQTKSVILGNLESSCNFDRLFYNAEIAASKATRAGRRNTKSNASCILHDE